MTKQQIWSHTFCSFFHHPLCLFLKRNGISCKQLNLEQNCTQAIIRCIRVMCILSLGCLFYLIGIVQLLHWVWSVAESCRQKEWQWQTTNSEYGKFYVKLHKEVKHLLHFVLYGLWIWHWICSDSFCKALEVSTCWIVMDNFMLVLVG